MSIGDNAGATPQARRAPRKAVRTLGEIVVNGKDHGMECTVLDMSGSGAKLKIEGAARKSFSPAVEIPESFRLLVARDNIAVDCRLAWRENDMVGVSFTSAFRPIKAATKRG